MPVAQRMTAEEFLALPENETARRVELVEGEVTVSEPTMLHNIVQSELLVALAVWIRAGGGRGRVCMPLDVGLDERNVLVPDICWYRESRAPDVHALRPYPVPDLVVEVRSPTTWIYDIGAKRAAYERHGLPELWLVDTAAAQLLEFRRSAPDKPSFDVALELGHGETLTTALLPGFELPLDRLFAAAR